MSGTFIIIKPDGSRAQERYEGKGLPADPAVIQKLVGGYIQMLAVRYQGKVRKGFVNEEGLDAGLPRNPHATALLARPVAMVDGCLRGNMVIWLPDPPPIISQYMSRLGSKGGRAPRERSRESYQAAVNARYAKERAAWGVYTELVEVAREVGAFLDGLSFPHQPAQEERRRDLTDRLFAAVTKSKGGRK